MNNTKQNIPKSSAFTPLRVALMIFIVVANLGAIIAHLFEESSWSEILGVISSVFIILMIFLQFLELVWLNSMRKHQKDEVVRKTYKQAIIIYLALLPIGIVISLLVLT